MGRLLVMGIVYFACYAFAGWILESIYASVRKKSFVNRGFLHGCFCPIYGVGALIIIAVSACTASLAVSTPLRFLLLFLISMMLVSLLEYITGLALEKLFHRRWWDYSGNCLNLGGHICLTYSLLWGGIALFFAAVMHPAAAKAVHALPGPLLTAAAVIAAGYFLADGIHSIWKHMKHELSASLAGTGPDFAEAVEDLLAHPKVQEMDRYIQHGHTTCLEHCLTVSRISCAICKHFRLDSRSAARGALLHDMFLYDWHEPDPGRSWHAFFHPAAALHHALSCFELNAVERDIILRHMWPLTLVWPRYRETLVVLMVDNCVSVWETAEGIRDKIREKKARKPWLRF